MWPKVRLGAPVADPSTPHLPPAPPPPLSTPSTSPLHPLLPAGSRRLAGDEAGAAVLPAASPREWGGQELGR
jgi:hypothetical protein